MVQCAVACCSGACAWGCGACHCLGVRLRPVSRDASAKADGDRRGAIADDADSTDTGAASIELDAPPARLPRHRHGDSSGIVASAARPGRVAACALPPANQSGTPVFALSDDSGRTWQTYPVSVLSKVSSCAILADTRRPDTFILGHAAFGSDYDDTPAAITTDGGRTWRALSWPPQAQIALGGSALVDGHRIICARRPRPSGGPSGLAMNGDCWMACRGDPVHIPQGLRKLTLVTDRPWLRATT